MWIVGLILFIQGAGSATTEVLWHSKFGVMGLVTLPWWSGYVVGVIGLILLVGDGLRVLANKKQKKAS
jgi:hypothetical protein